MDALTDFIQTTRDGRELKRALAVKMRLSGYSRSEAAAVLEVSEAFIDKWRGQYARKGVACLSLKYQGSSGYLSPQDKTEVLAWIQRQTTWDVRAVQQHVTETYGVRYKSPQSYYALLDAAHMSWKKSQDRQPKADPQKVTAKREEIKKKTHAETPAIILKRTVIVAADECHLLWGDARGYVWGPKGERIELPIENIRDRQTYYGALNLLTGWPVLWEAETANKEHTVEFLKYLRQCFQGRRLIVLWDGASYHTAHLVQDYLTQINGPDCPEPERRIQLIQFAPYAPTQNPMEDVWLAGKRQVRQQWADVQAFADAKEIFSTTIRRTLFYFEKLNWYGRDHLIKARRAHGLLWE